MYFAKSIVLQYLPNSSNPVTQTQEPLGGGGSNTGFWGPDNIVLYIIVAIIVIALILITFYAIQRIRNDGHSKNTSMTQGNASAGTTKFVPCPHCERAIDANTRSVLTADKQAEKLDRSLTMKL